MTIIHMRSPSIRRPRRPAVRARGPGRGTFRGGPVPFIIFILMFAAVDWLVRNWGSVADDGAEGVKAWLENRRPRVP